MGTAFLLLFQRITKIRLHRKLCHSEHFYVLFSGYSLSDFDATLFASLWLLLNLYRISNKILFTTHDLFQIFKLINLHNLIYNFLGELTSLQSVNRFEGFSWYLFYQGFWDQMRYSQWNLLNTALATLSSLWKTQMGR